MDRRQFEEFVREAVDDLPEEFARRLHNVEIVVEDEPQPELLRALGMRPQRDTLFGLYQGVPLPLRGSAHGNVLPDKISIYYRPLVQAFRSPQRLREQVRK